MEGIAVRTLPLPVLLLVLGCGCGDPEPASGPVRRVVSLLPAFTETIDALGASSLLVGCTSFCPADEGVPHVPWQDAGAAEAILRRRPDLVVKQRPRRAEDALAVALHRAGVRVLARPSETIADVRAAIAAIGTALGRGERARALLEEFDARLAAVRERHLGRPRPRVLLVFQRDPGRIANVMAAGPGSFLDELIRAAGGRNALEGAERAYVGVDLERLVRLDADVIVDVVPQATGGLAPWRELEHVTARVHAVRDATLLTPGPRLPEAVARLAELLHGE